jgi:hypothetical protein
VRLIAASLGLAAVIAAMAAGASAAPTALTLHYNGAHLHDASLPAGVRHVGRFTASAPFCATGTATDVRDVEIEPLSVMRVHTCDDGSGSVTAWMPGVLGEHGGNGTWQIVDGTGRYATLRGVGTYTGHIISGDPQVPESVVYETSWQGIVDFDAVAPTLTATATAKKLRHPKRTYVVKTLVDAHEAASYSVDIRAGKSFLAYKKAQTTSGRATVKSRVGAPRGVRDLTVIVTAADAVGNESTTTLSVKLKAR